jgi:hypothetical protein
MDDVVIRDSQSAEKGLDGGDIERQNTTVDG